MWKIYKILKKCECHKPSWNLRKKCAQNERWQLLEKAALTTGRVQKGHCREKRSSFIKKWKGSPGMKNMDSAKVCKQNQARQEF